MKKNKFYLLSTGSIFILNAFIYFFIKLFIKDYNLIGSSLDNLIPFLPSFIYFYMIWYPFEIYSLFLVYKADKKHYIKTIVSLVLSLIIMHLIFITYPTMVNRPDIDSFNSLTTLIVYIAFKSDTPVNCFPSGHCILCFIMIFSILKSKNITFKIKSTIISLNILIILSTIFVKQHVLIDIIGALIVSIISFYFLSNLKIFDKLKKKLANLS